jgi:hypothetical protein
MTLSAIEALRVLLAILFLFAPGILLVTPLLGPFRPRGGVVVPLGLGLGLGAFGLFLWIDARLGVSLSAWIAFWGLLVVVGLLMSWVRRRHIPPPDPASPYAFTGVPGGVVLGVCVAAALAAPHFGAYQGASADSWDYMNRATSILRADRLEAPNPYSPELHNPYDPTFYGMIASIARLSGVAPARLWQLFPAVATPMEIGVVAFATAAIVGSSAAGAAAAVVYTGLYGPFFLFRNSGHHQMLGDVPYLIALAALFLYWRHGRRRLLFLGVAACVAGVTYHHFILVQSAFAIAVAALALTLYSRRDPDRVRRAVLFTGTAAIVLLPMFLFLHFTYLDKLDPKSMNRSFAELVSPLLHFGPLYMPDPFPWYFRSFWRPLPAVFLLIYFLSRYRRDPRAGALAFLVAAPLLVVFNPLVFPVVAAVTGLQVGTRLLNLTTYPSVILFGWVVAEAVTGRRLPGGESPNGPGTGSALPVSRILAVTCAALSFLLILPQMLIRWQMDLSPAGLRHEWENSPASYSRGLEELARQARPGQVVLSDFVTAYAVPSFAPLSIVANFRDDFAFQTDDYPERLRAIDQVLGPLTPPDSTLRALSRYTVDWILVNRRLTNPLTVDKLDLMADRGTGITRKFDVQGLVGYAVADPHLPEDPALAATFQERVLIPESTFALLREPGTGLSFDQESGIGAVVGPDSAAAGDTLYVTLYYEARDQPAQAGLYPKLLREEAYGSRWRWFTRTIRNWMLGRLDSILFPRVTEFQNVRARRLPPGSVFADSFDIPIPPGVTAGHYGLYVREGAFPTEGSLGRPLGSVVIVGPRRVTRPR